MLQKVIHTLEKIDRFDICVDLKLFANGNLSRKSCRSLLLLLVLCFDVETANTI